MKTAHLRFYGRLGIIARTTHKCINFTGTPAILDLVQSAGVPRTEVFLILKNQEIVSIHDRVADGDRIAIYPRWMNLENLILYDLAHKESRVYKEYLERYVITNIDRFVADVHLGKLTKYLRLLGIDVMYNPEWDDSDLINLSLAENRVLLTQDRGILFHKKLKYGYLVLSRVPAQQLSEVIEFFNLAIKPFTRCSVCNGELVLAEKEEIKENYCIPEKVLDTFEEFYICRRCEQVYWEGSHFENMKKFFQNLSIFHNTGS